MHGGAVGDARNYGTWLKWRSDRAVMVLEIEEHGRLTEEIRLDPEATRVLGESLLRWSPAPEQDTKQIHRLSWNAGPSDGVEFGFATVVDGREVQTQIQLTREEALQIGQYMIERAKE